MTDRGRWTPPITLDICQHAKQWIEERGEQAIPEVLHSSDLAELLGCPVKTIHAWAAAKLLPGTQLKRASRWLCGRQAFLKWIQLLWVQLDQTIEHGSIADRQPSPLINDGTADDSESVLSIRQAAQLLRFHPETIRLYAQQNDGCLPSEQLDSGYYVVYRSRLLKKLNQLPPGFRVG